MEKDDDQQISGKDSKNRGSYCGRAGSHDEMFLIVRPPKGLSLPLFSIVQNPFHGLYPMAREAVTCGGVHRCLGESVSVSPFIKLVATNEYTGEPCSQARE